MPQACFKRRTSRTWRIRNLLAGMALPASIDTRATLPPVAHRQRQARRTRWPASSDSVAGLDRNQWPDWIGITGRFASECALAYYPPERNDERMSMADMPEGAELIDNPVSVAPGFRLENVYVLPGVPKIMQAMVLELLPTLGGGTKMLSRTITVFAPEGDVARGLGAIQAKFPELEIGSYPFFRVQGAGTSIVIRGHDRDRIDLAAGALYTLADELKAETQEEYT
jgi:molybdopterin-biosynthesis enzyme MoeA-like protein